MADERLTLATPVATATTNWRIRVLTIERGLRALPVGDVNEGEIVNDPTRSFIEVILIGEDDNRLQHRWTGQPADDLIVQLNKANNSTTSLNRRIFNKLIADGVLAGAAAGTPD